MHVEITISKIPITALCDTGSQATIINEKTYQKLGYPTLSPSQCTFSGIGRDRVESKGYFKNFITIQNTALPAKIHVVNDETIPLDAIIGIDFLQQTKFTFGRAGIRIFRDVDECKNDDVLVNLANPFDEQQCKLDLPHISNSKIRNDVEQLVNSYKPKKIYDTDLKMTILLSDDIPVSQRSRRLPFVEQKIVENQIQEWLNTNIIKPSCSDYAAPIVLCKKKNGEHRLCVDYRNLNRKMIKDKFPLPLIEEVLDKLENSKVYTSLDLKNGFFHVPMDPNKFLGYIIENGTIKPSPSKTQAVQNFPQPQTPRQLQSFIGLTSYFRKFIPNYARIARPLSDLLRDNVKFKFGPTEIASFQELKNILSENPVLHVFQQGYPLELHTDASSLGFGAVLLQKSDGLFHPIHYFSRKTTVQQEKYSSYELEVLAIIEALKKFRSYLLGTKFKIITDCDAFQKTMHKKDLPAKLARWALMLEEFDYEVCHRPGRQMKHVDALSRYPIMMISSHDITQKIKEAQNKDEFISQLKSAIKITPSDEYFLKNEILYKLHKDSELLVVPEMMQREIDVITNCVPCILSSRKAGKQEGFLHPIPKGDQPLDCYHCDFLGPLPSTKKCYKHLFTVIDSFSKFVWIYPVKSTSTKDALDKLILQQTIFCNPSKIITDKGSAFTSTEFQKFCQEESIEHVQITTGVPRGNGQIERMHETIIPVLTKLTIEEPEKWFKHVHRLQRIMNSTTTRSTKFTPFEVLIGVKMKQKEDLQIKHLLEDEVSEQFINKRETLRNEAKENILRLQAENKKQYNKHRKLAYNYKPGDTVAIQRTQFGTGLKIRPKYFGPYEVTKVNKHDRYEVQKIGQHKGPNVTSTAADKMKKCSLVPQRRGRRGHQDARVDISYSQTTFEAMIELK
ncbi:transposon Tf2-8 polyprotein [Trichonephila clavipes]|nr:transposon Tf2-8 polyprotein [Trichonephila clavipes]